MYKWLKFRHPKLILDAEMKLEIVEFKMSILFSFFPTIFVKSSVRFRRGTVAKLIVSGLILLFSFVEKWALEINQTSLTMSLFSNESFLRVLPALVIFKLIRNSSSFVHLTPTGLIGEGCPVFLLEKPTHTSRCDLSVLN